MEIIVIILMSLTCMGLFIAMQKGHILSFFRQPAVDIMDSCVEMYNLEVKDIHEEFAEKKRNMLVNFCETVHGPNQNEITKRQLSLERDMKLKKLEKEHYKTLSVFTWLKPWILCCWCFASTYGSLSFWSLHIWYYKDVSTALIPIYIISLLGCMVLNAILDSLFRNLKIY